MEATEDMADSLLVLKDQGSQRACHWACPVCEQEFQTSKDYLTHVELFHEELTVVDNRYVRCRTCQVCAHDTSLVMSFQFKFYLVL